MKLKTQNQRNQKQVLWKEWIDKLLTSLTKKREDMNLLISEMKESITTNVMYNKGMVGQSMNINLMT